MAGANLQAANLSDTLLFRVDLDSADLRGADLRGADLSGPRISGGDLKYINWAGGMGGSTVGPTNADLRGADLRRAKLNYANLQGADLRGVDLSDVDLSAVSLKDADLRGANLIGTRPGCANLSGTNLRGTTLRGAKFSGINLSNADLTGTDLSDADLTSSLLLYANLTGTPISNADISGAHLGNTVFGDLDLRTVTGLETCIHRGPSVLDHRTLIRSGPLPLVFLRGCGLPDRLIEYLPSLLETAIQFYSCFISYATEDQAFADRLFADLQNKGVRCWFAPQSAKGGEKLHEQIDEAIRQHDKLLLILSPASIRSEWVKTEIAKARKKERQQHRRVLFPLRLIEYETLREWECFDGDTGEDSAKEIREFYIPDFSRWRNYDAYSSEFERLLRDLTTP